MATLSEEFRTAIKNASGMACYRCHQPLVARAEDSTMSVQFHCRTCDHDQITMSVRTAAEYQEMMQLARVR